MKKLVFVFGLVFLLVGCASAAESERHVSFISHIPPKHFATAHTSLALAEAFVEAGDLQEAYIQYRKAFAETNDEVPLFEYFAAVVMEKIGASQIAYSHAKNVLEKHADSKAPLPAFYLEQVQNMIAHLEPRVIKIENARKNIKPLTEKELRELEDFVAKQQGFSSWEEYKKSLPPEDDDAAED